MFTFMRLVVLVVPVVPAITKVQSEYSVIIQHMVPENSGIKSMTTCIKYLQQASTFSPLTFHATTTRQPGFRLPTVRWMEDFSEFR